MYLLFFISLKYLSIKNYKIFQITKIKLNIYIINLKIKKIKKIYNLKESDYKFSEV